MSFADSKLNMWHL